MEMTVEYKGIKMYMNKMDNGYWNARAAYNSISQIDRDLEQLIEKFGEKLLQLYGRD